MGDIYKLGEINGSGAKLNRFWRVNYWFRIVTKSGYSNNIGCNG